MRGASKPKALPTWYLLLHRPLLFWRNKARMKDNIGYDQRLVYLLPLIGFFLVFGLFVCLFFSLKRAQHWITPRSIVKIGQKSAAKSNFEIRRDVSHVTRGRLCTSTTELEFCDFNSKTHVFCRDFLKLHARFMKLCCGGHVFEEEAVADWSKRNLPFIHLTLTCNNEWHLHSQAQHLSLL